MTSWRSWPVLAAAPEAAVGVELAGSRGDILWNLDKNADIRFSHENPEVRALYNAYFHKPLSHRSHELLHTDLTAWKMPTEE